MNQSRSAQGNQAAAVLKKVNPFRSDISWQVVLAQGIGAIAIGLYALLAEESARQTVLFLIGLYLLVAGVMLAWSSLRGDAEDPMAPYRYLRAGIGIATGLIVVIDRFNDFMGINPARVVAGIGLLAMGLVTLVGLVATRSEGGLAVGPLAGATLLAAWGIVLLYQASNDTTSSGVLGWSVLVIGVLLVAVAVYRRQRATTAAAPA